MQKIDKRNKAHGGLGRAAPEAHAFFGVDKSRVGRNRHDNRRVRWVFTHPFNEENPFCAIPSNRKIDREADWLYGQLVDECTKLVFQLEQGDPASEREEEKYLHWQGYFELSSKRGFAWIREFVHPFWYVTPSKGKPTQAWGYCCRKDTQVRGPWQLGKPSNAEGHGKQIELYREAIENGKSDWKLALEFAECWEKYPRIREQIRNTPGWKAETRGEPALIKETTPSVHVLDTTMFDSKVYEGLSQEFKEQMLLKQTERALKFEQGTDKRSLSR